MINCYDDCDNIVTESVHNAEMISAYLNNIAIDLLDVLPDNEYKILCDAGDILWAIKDNLPEE